MPIATAADGCRIYYERTGTGPVVALIPGLGGDGRFWSGVAGRLADRFDLIHTWTIAAPVGATGRTRPTALS